MLDTLTPQQRDQLLALLLTKNKADIDITTPTAQALHDNGGLLSWGAMRPQIVNAMVVPRSALDTILPVRPSNMRDVLYPILTGMTASTGTHPTEPCEPGKQPGNLKLCNQVFPWGRIVASSKVIDTKEVSWRKDRTDFLDYRIIGNPLAAANTTIPGAGSPQRALANDVESELFKLWVAYYRDNMDMLYTGDYAAYQALTPSQGHFPFNGLDILINDGKVDVMTGDACSAADSLVEDAGGLDIATNSSFYVNLMSDMLYNRQREAGRTGLGPVTFAWSMDEGSFRALSRVWPCAYNTSGCMVGGAGMNPSNVSPDVQRRMQDEMYNGKYLLFDGVRVPVIIEETETIGGTSVLNGNGTRTYTVNFKLIPLQSPAFDGGWITYKERLSFTDAAGQISTQQAMRMLNASEPAQFFEGGTVLMLTEHKLGCVYVTLFKFERLIMEAPFLAARLDNVTYTPRYAERSAFPGGPGFDTGGYEIGPTVTYDPLDVTL